MTQINIFWLFLFITFKHSCPWTVALYADALWPRHAIFLLEEERLRERLLRDGPLFDGGGGRVGKFSWAINVLSPIYWAWLFSSVIACARIFFYQNQNYDSREYLLHFFPWFPQNDIFFQQFPVFQETFSQDCPSRPCPIVKTKQWSLPKKAT